METKLDRYGRVVIPKKVRDDLGLEAGDRLEIREGEGGILLKPLREDGHVIVKDGILVFTGVAAGDLEGTLQALREERIRYITGLGRE